MKRFLLIFLSINAVLFGAANAQTPNKTDEQNSTQQQATPADIANADVVILANVRARELKFETVPNPTVEFPGTHERKTFWETDRENLPRPAQPGVTYRNIGIELRIVSRFADIERIVAEALGEIPISDSETKQTNAQTSNEKKQTPEQPKKPE